MKDYVISKTLAVVRGVAIILVVLAHSIIPSIRTQYSPLNYIWNGIYSFHMFLFFFCSGYLFEKGLPKYTKQRKKFICNKFMLLLIPYITLTVFDYSILMFERIQIFDKIFRLCNLPGWSFRAFVEALIFNNQHYDTHLWFIYVLFFVFTINISIPKASRHIVYFLVMLVFSACNPFLGKVIIPIRNIFYWTVPFWIGRKFYQQNILNKIFEFSSRVICLFGGLFIVLNWGINAINEYTQGVTKIPLYVALCSTYLIKHITGILGTVILFYLIYRLLDSKICDLFIKLNDYSYDIYLVHQPFLTVGIATVLTKVGVNSYLAIGITTMLAIIISILFSKIIIRRSKVLGFFVLGNRNVNT